jgi:hypothetical protein
MQNENQENDGGRAQDPKTQADQLNDRTRQIGQQQSEQTGQASAPARESDGEQGPSKSGNAGYGGSGSQTQDVTEERMEQMSHADGSSDMDDNPDV